MTLDIDVSNYLFNACRLRSEESTRDNYAADLQRSLQGELSTPELARQFFQSTYPTIGMKDICRGIFSRLRQGDASNEPSVYRLGSSFGGGKTHTLIALAGASPVLPIDTGKRNNGPGRIRSRGTCSAGDIHWRKQ